MHHGMCHFTTSVPRSNMDDKVKGRSQVMEREKDRNRK